MSDVKRYIEKRIETDTEFADGFEVGYANFKIGEMLRQAKANMHAPWLNFTAFFAIAIMLSLLIFVGEGVRDAFDPRKQVTGDAP